ncbi:BCCT family transporter [Microbulbifer elongatus]|uniref:BCCT family transporter n=1 Tax=Microbulbifer elongatus TaxID=86173 RepID=UPI001E581A4B|nr:BCCT family transporter [Microbulbifer elongatus]
MWTNPTLVAGLALTLAVAIWGLVDAPALGLFAARVVEFAFLTRGWFVMVLMSAIVIMALYLMFSRYGRLRLGRNDEKPEFSRVTWITMMFAAGMGVGLLYWSVAEPLSHFALASDYGPEPEAARRALLITNFHWGIHAWAMFGLTGLVIAYFSFRRGAPQLLSAPLAITYGNRPWTRYVGVLVNVAAIYAVAIGVAGSIGMGIFQVRDGIGIMLGGVATGPWLTAILFAALCVGFLLPLTVDLNRGMGRLSNAAFSIALALLLFVAISGPTYYVMNVLVDAFGAYVGDVIPRGFRTYTFFDDKVRGWFADWTLTYMVWWISWAPFVGVFIARISRGRTIREYLCAVIFLPSLFSVLWYGVFGGLGFYETLEGKRVLIEAVKTNIDSATFVLLDILPLAWLTQAAVIVSGFLFVITSVVSAALVLAMFTDRGNPEPSTRIKLTWGGIVAALGLAMILTGNIEVVRTIIVMAALPFLLILPLLYVTLLKALKSEKLE